MTSAQAPQQRRPEKAQQKQISTKLLSIHSPQRFDQSQCRMLQVFVPHVLPNRVTIYDVLLAGVVTVRVASFFGVSHLRKRLGPAASTWTANVHFLVHLHELAVQVLPFRSLDALIYGLAIGIPIFVHGRLPSTVRHFGGVDERAQHPFFTFTKRQFIYSFSDRIREILFVEPGPDLIASEFFSRSPIFTASWLSSSIR